MDIEDILKYKTHISPEEDDIKMFIEDFLTFNLNVKKEVLDETFRLLKKKHRVLPSKGDLRIVYNKYFVAIFFDIRIVTYNNNC